jgi:hypothetical protein
MTHYFTFTTESWQTIRTGFDSHDEIITVTEWTIETDGNQLDLSNEEDHYDISDEVYEALVVKYKGAEEADFDLTDKYFLIRNGLHNVDHIVPIVLFEEWLKDFAREFVKGL